MKAHNKLRTIKLAETKSKNQNKTLSPKSRAKNYEQYFEDTVVVLSLYNLQFQVKQAKDLFCLHTNCCNSIILILICQTRLTHRLF